MLVVRRWIWLYFEPRQRVGLLLESIHQNKKNVPLVFGGNLHVGSKSSLYQCGWDWIGTQSLVTVHKVAMTQKHTPNNDSNHGHASGTDQGTFFKETWSTIFPAWRRCDNLQSRQKMSKIVRLPVSGKSFWCWSRLRSRNIFPSSSDSGELVQVQESVRQPSVFLLRSELALAKAPKKPQANFGSCKSQSSLLNKNVTGRVWDTVCI